MIEVRWFSLFAAALTTLVLNLISQPLHAGVFRLIRQIVAGNYHTCVLTGEGAQCWGKNEYSQTSVPGDLVNPTQIAAGDYHTCALTGEGVRCWGNNQYGQTSVPGDLVNPTQIAAGGQHTCALTEKGVQCWGNGLLTKVPANLVNPTQIAAGRQHTCALTSEGVRCWGGNYYGQTDVPAVLINPTQIVAKGDNTCAFTPNGAKCWGNTADRAVTTPPDDPVNLIDPNKVAEGDGRICIILTDEDVKCWGYDRYSQVMNSNVFLSIPDFFYGLSKLKEHVYAEKHYFLDFLSKSIEAKATNQEAFLFFTLKPFFEAISSTWAARMLQPDLPVVTKYYRKRFRTSSLKDFERSSIYLTHSLNILSHALTSTRSMLTLEGQREVSEDLLPILAEKLAKTELTPGDAEDIAALFTSHQLTLTEMHNTPRLVPFAKMIKELTNWLGGNRD